MITRLNSPGLKRPINDIAIKRNNAKWLKDFHINILNNCIYLFNNNNYELSDFEFVNNGNIFYYKISDVSGVDSLKSDSSFCDDIAEMFCVIFKTSELSNEFRTIFKSSLSDVIHIINKNYSEEVKQESYKLLGISTIDINFWKNIFSLLEKEFDDSIIDETDFLFYIKKNIDFDLPDCYKNIDLENFCSQGAVNFLNYLSEKTHLEIAKIHRQGLLKWYTIKFEEIIKDKNNLFDALMWKKLSQDKDNQKMYISFLNQYKNETLDKLVNNLGEDCYNPTFDYSTAFINKILDIFKINLSEDEDISLWQNTIFYHDLLKKYSLAETDIQDEGIRSLLYFKGNDNIIDIELKRLSDTTQAQEIFNPAERREITFISIKKGVYNHNSTSLRTVLHSEKREKTKHVVGKKSETIVYNSLVESYGISNVRWVSGNSNTPDKNDNCHYDIEYKKESEWKYLEVKTFINDHITISKDEIIFGQNEKEKYQIALVNGDRIFIIEDIFNYPIGKSLENNDVFTAVPTDYLFVFDADSMIINSSV